jgi:hypothetical protein
MTVIVARASGPTTLGAVRGLFFLARQQQARAQWPTHGRR